MIAGDKKFLLTVGSRENAGLGIIHAVGEKLQSQKRMSGAAFSQINLDGVRLPCSILHAHDHKIQSEATNNTFLGQAPAYLCSFLSNQTGISCVGREKAAQIALPRWPAQELIVR